jgi:hypothetical protein
MESVVYAIVLGSHGWMGNDGFFYNKESAIIRICARVDCLGRKGEQNKYLALLCCLLLWLGHCDESPLYFYLYNMEIYQLSTDPTCMNAAV